MTLTPDEFGAAASRQVFNGKLLDVRVETVAYPDGSTGDLEIVRHPGAAAVLPILGADPECDAGTPPSVILLRQYRHAVGGVIWEVPAGRLETGEEPEACARRELLEEAGVTAGRIEALWTLMTTPGFTDERIHLFLARELSFGEASPEGHEFIEVHTLELERALTMLDDGEITDAKTVACLALAARRLALR